MRNKKLLVVGLILAFAFAGCSDPTRTVIPQNVAATHASADGNQFTSGILSADANGFLVTPRYLERYDALLAKYGGRLLPPMSTGDRRGITPEGENYRFTAEARGRFTLMNGWLRDDRSGAR